MQLMMIGAWDTANDDRGICPPVLMMTRAWDTAGGDRDMGHS